MQFTNPNWARNTILLGLVMLAGASMRVIKIDQPFVDDFSYRQSDVALVARNFYIGGYNLLRPRIDYAGTNPGYVGMEFPIVPFIAAIIYGPFGEHETIGRLISVVFFLLSVPPLFFIVEMAHNRRAALIASILYTIIPLTIFCGRSFMSDMAALCFSVWAVWLFYSWFQHSSRWRLLGAVMTTAAAVLTKAPYVLVGFPMAYIAIEQFGVRALINRKLLLFGCLSLAPSVIWYSYATWVAASNYPFVPFLGHPDSFATIITVEGYKGILEETVRWLTPEVVLLALVGLVLLKTKPSTWIFVWWSVGMVFLLVFASQDNYFHPWYRLPVTAPVAALAGLGADWLLSRKFNILRRAGLAAALTAGIGGLIAYQSFSFVRDYYEPRWEALRAAGEAVDQLVPQDALIVFTSWDIPTAVYYSRRHGWLFFEHSVVPRNTMEAISMLDLRRRQGASYAVVTSLDAVRYYPLFWQYLEAHFKQIFRTPDFTIFELGPIPAREPLSTAP